MSLSVYPASPALVAPEKLHPSAAFKKQVTKTIFAILLFCIVYVLLVVAAIGLAVACCYLGIVIIAAVHSFISLVAGLGLMAVGISVIFFLIKFIFAVTKNENPLRIEITEDDQPELFDFIRKLSRETKTPFPKKIFISPDVNACVFYNSSFWSMLFPVRKNLEIGLGLVNSINISELKAVIAHEFGHFSQRSMKLGSFTYNVNKIIYDMLFNNNSYTNFLNAWGKLHGLLSLFATITYKIAQGIQYILRQVYKIVNKNYMGLSREMEFHADAVAASVAGGNNVVSGLSRLEIASSSYDTILNKANELLKENKQLNNIFTSQLTVYKEIASSYKLPVKQGLPEISFDFIESFSTSRINYKNQWASHPALKERKENIDRLNINVDADTSSAWIVFNNAESLQETLTEKLYSQVNTETALQKIGEDVFDEQHNKDAHNYILPDAYKGYYDKRFIDIKEWDVEALAKQAIAKNFDELFTEEHAQLQPLINNNLADIETLKAIRDKQIDTKSFDFEGVKYSRAGCDAIIQQLEKENEEKTALLKQLDKEAFVLFSSNMHGLDAAYNAFKITSKKYDDYVDDTNNMLKAMQPFYDGGLTLEQVNATVNKLKSFYESKLKKQLVFFIDEGIISKGKNEKLFSNIQLFLQKDYCYFANNKFMNDELNTISDIAIKAANAFYDYKFCQYKELLEKQLSGYRLLRKSA